MGFTKNTYCILGFTMIGIGVLFGDDAAIDEPGLSNQSVTLVEELIILLMTMCFRRSSDLITS